MSNLIYFLIGAFAMAAILGVFLVLCLWVDTD